MLSTWLVELNLNHLGKLKESGDTEEMKKSKENFQKFLAQVRIYVDNFHAWYSRSIMEMYSLLISRHTVA